eukprot:gene46420-56847_t
MPRSAYAHMFGPTTGDKVRLADTSLIIEVEKDFTVHGEEVKFGGGKVIRDGMGQGQLLAAEVVDTLITNALIIDHWGIVKADVGLKDGRIAAIGKAGYEAKSETIRLEIEDMTCASCVARVERALKTVPGVTAANVNLATERATVTGTADLASLIGAIADAGYEARAAAETAIMSEESAAKKTAEEAALRRDVLFAAALTLPVFVLEMGSHLFLWVHMAVMNSIGMQNSWYIQFALTTVVLLGPGLRFYRKGFPALARLAPDMNSLVA